MKFYKLTCGENVNYKDLYKRLESIGNFIINHDEVFFYAKSLKKSYMVGLDGCSIEEIDGSKYNLGNTLSDEWIRENYRKFRVEDLLKKGESEKQDELKNLYNIIKAAEDIIDRKEDLVEQK